MTLGSAGRVTEGLPSCYLSFAGLSALCLDNSFIYMLFYKTISYDGRTGDNWTPGSSQ